MPRAERGQTNYLFTVANYRADAIAAVAMQYSDTEIAAAITPIRGQEAADIACVRAVRVKEGESGQVPKTERAKVEERYAELGRKGAYSMVELSVPGGGRTFDFGSFYERVNDLIGDADAPEHTATA